MRTRVKPTFCRPEMKVGYNSHGFESTFEEIVEVEQERENYPFNEWEEKDITPYGSCPAIWVTRNPMDAFRYSIPASEWNWSDEEIMKKYPHWEEEVVSIDCTTYHEVGDTDDGDNGILLVQLNR